MISGFEMFKRIVLKGLLLTKMPLDIKGLGEKSDLEIRKEYSSRWFDNH
jgi:hypothetical protein